ncbi:MAG: hypothetical protein J0M08_06350 [Bacteroidetes bacterium]|nr:hypothetical protein [Bacteroidota bacterium]
MKLGFLVLIHRYQEQASKLIETLIKNDVQLFIHVDLKSEETYNFLYRKYNSNSKIIFTKRYKVYWGSFNQIKATLELITTAVAKSKCSYYSLISGQDFPIKKITEFASFLEQHKGQEFLSHFKLPNTANWGENGGLERLYYYWIDILSQRHSYKYNKLNALIHKLQDITGIKRKLNYNFYGGPNWFTLSHEALQYVCEYVKDNPKYLQRFKYTSTADEIFIQTILLNSAFADKITNDDLRYINWATGPEYPKILRDEDYTLLTNAPSKFFGRKFDCQIDNTIIEKLQQKIND